MNSERTVKIVINNNEVEGVVTHRSQFDFFVTITKPFQNISGGAHIPFFARRYTFDGAYGDGRILETLRGLYQRGK